MPDVELENLQRRHALIRKTVLCAFAIAGTALLVRGYLISPSIGIEGVHVPYDVPKHRLANQDLTLVWAGFGWIHLLLGELSQIVGAGAVLVFVWAMIEKRRRFALYSIGVSLLLSLFSPIPLVTQPSPPKAMTLNDAKAFASDVKNFHSQDPASRRYMQAQVAYLEGDSRRAQQLSAGLTERDLSSPTQAEYRLQFLQNRPQAQSNVCLKRGCLSHNMLEMARAVSVAAFLTALVFALASFWLFSVLGSRIARIDALRSMSRTRTRQA